MCSSRFLLLEEYGGESVNMDEPKMCYPPKVTATTDLYSCDGVKASAMERAKELQSNLSMQFPSFLKPMLRSQVSGGFWLGLPRKFCLAYLPKQDETVVLVDENEQEYNAKYLVHKNGLSGGWRGFSIAHNLLDGDVLVFQLIEPSKFKLYIVRPRRLAEVDVALTLQNLVVHAKPINAVKMEAQLEENVGISQTESQKYPWPLAVDNNHGKDAGRSSISEPGADQSGYHCGRYGSPIMNGVRLSESLLSFESVKSFDDFSIDVHGLILNSELSMHLRTKYYELCCSQNMFLHSNLIQELNSKLAAGMISEIVNIADAIRATNSTTAPDQLEIWDKTLKAFEDLGMVVGFLHARVHKLLSLSREFQAIVKLKKTNRAAAEDEMRDLKVKLLNVEKLIESLDAEINAFQVKNEEHSLVFKEVAGSSW